MCCLIKKIVHLLYPLHPYRGSSLHHLFVWVETQQRGMELSVLLFNLSPELYPTMGKRLHIPKEKPAGGPHKVRSYCCYVCSLLQKALCILLKSASGAVAELTWACPKCRHESKDHPRKYVCYCGKVQDPPFDPWILPHSCGEVCKRKLSPKCGHQCLILCHPGPCPPCPKVSRNSQPSFIFSPHYLLLVSHRLTSIKQIATNNLIPFLSELRIISDSVECYALNSDLNYDFG